MRLFQNENATSSVFVFSLCSVPFRFFFDYQTLIDVNNSVWLTEEVCLVTFILCEVSSSALRFLIVGVVTVRREGDFAFYYSFLQSLQNQKNPRLLHVLSQFNFVLVPFQMHTANIYII